MCQEKKTFIGKIFGNNIKGFEVRINQYIFKCKTRGFNLKMSTLCSTTQEKQQAGKIEKKGYGTFKIVTTKEKIQTESM